MPVNSGVECGPACESATAPYLKTDETDETRLYQPRPAEGAFLRTRRASEDSTHAQCPQDPDRGRRYRSARYVGGAIIAARRVRSLRRRYPVSYTHLRAHET